MVARYAVALAVAAAGAFAGTAYVYRGGLETRVDFERGYEGPFVERFYPRERASGSFFRWSADESFLSFENLPTGGPVEVVLTIRAVRPGGGAPRELAFTVNGVTWAREQAVPGIASYTFRFPAVEPSLRIGVETETFRAGRRELGVQVLAVELRSTEAASTWLAPSLWASLAAVLLVLAGAFAGVPAWVTGSVVVSLVWAFLMLLQAQAARFTSYPRQVVVLAVATVLVVLFFRFAWTRRPAVLGTLGLLFVLKLGALTYPLMSSSDADFQANRMAEFMAGNRHPTSVTQHDPPFRIPYPVSLYATAAPLVLVGLERVDALLRTTAAFDLLISVVLLYVGWRLLSNLRAGLLAAVLYQLVPINSLAFSAGNYTNLFAVSALTLGFAGVVSAAKGSRRGVVLATVSIFFALTAHFGMLIEASLLVPVWLVLLWNGPTPANDHRKLLTISVAAAFVAAGVYYLGYWDLMTGQLDRALSGNASSAGGPTVANKVTLRTALVSEQLGWLFVIAAVAGALLMVQRRHRGPVEAAATGWIGVTVVFFVVSLVSPVEIRFLLQALPILALCAGYYLSGAIERGRIGQLAAIGVTAFIVLNGIQTLYEVAVVRYH